MSSALIQARRIIKSMDHLAHLPEPGPLIDRVSVHIRYRDLEFVSWVVFRLGVIEVGISHLTKDPIPEIDAVSYIIVHPTIRPKLMSWYLSHVRDQGPEWLPYLFATQGPYRHDPDQSLWSPRPLDLVEAIMSGGGLPGAVYQDD